MLTDFLMKPAVNKALSQLTDKSSMLPVVMRDEVDNLGRYHQAQKRDPHDGRERLIEEHLTTVLWGFGVSFLKKYVLDRWAGSLSGGKIKLPALDMNLLKGGAQQLSAEVIKKYMADEPALAKHLATLLKSPSLKRAYQRYNITKFGVATGLPVALIAVGIPAFNQYWTRKKLAEETVRKPRPLLFQSHTVLRKPGAYQAFQPYFSGGITGSMFKLLQNERANTLLVDGSITGGRTLMARNFYERLEVLFQEANIIFFLYYAGDALQKGLQTLADKHLGLNTGLHFKTLKMLAERLEKGNLLSEIQQLPSKPDVSWLREAVSAGNLGDFMAGLARETGWVPVRMTKSGKTVADITQQMNLEAFTAETRLLKELAARFARKRVHLAAFLKKSLRGKFITFAAANAISSLFLAWGIPGAKQLITQHLTGSRAFPGRFVDA